MTPAQRDRFDRLLEEVLDDLPELARRTLESITLVVEDYPSEKVLRDLGIEHRDELCGLYSGVSLIDRSVDAAPGEAPLSDCVTLFRVGILRMAQDEQGRIRRDELRRQMRITVLHELGHHHGLDEDDLEELGYG